MFEHMDFLPVPHTGESQTIRDRPSKYERWPSQKYEDKRAGRTERQRNFHDNLNRMALASGSDTLPVDFTARDGKQMYLDRGCIKMAENSGFICELSNDPDGVVSEIKLSNPPWTGERQRRQPGSPGQRYARRSRIRRRSLHVRADCTLGARRTRAQMDHVWQYRRHRRTHPGACRDRRARTCGLRSPQNRGAPPNCRERKRSWLQVPSNGSTPPRGYGFIEPEDGSRDVFVHISAVERAGLATLNEGQKVSFELMPGRDGKTSAENLALSD